MLYLRFEQVIFRINIFSHNRTLPNEGPEMSNRKVVTVKIKISYNNLLTFS